MITPLKRTPLHDLLNKPVLFDANIFMVGIEDRISNKNCSFENMKQLYIQPLFESFTDIYIHDEVYKELDENAKKMVDTYIGKNVTIVKEDGVYGTDPLYTTILAYAAYHKMNYFCSKEIMVDNIAHELKDLQDIDIITFDIIVLAAYIYYVHKNDFSNTKGLKSIYKRYCADVIKRHGLPKTLNEYIKASLEYL